MWQMALPAAISAGASLLGGAQAQAVNVREARRNREFQERMRNTQWQAAVSDMTAAGVNPALAIARGPNAAPGGATASVSDMVTPAVGSAMQAERLRNDLQLMKANIQRARSEASSARQKAARDRWETDFAEARQMFYFTADGRPKPEMQRLLRRQFEGDFANSSRSIYDAELARFSVPERRAYSQLFESRGGTPLKGVQLALPLMLQMMRLGGRGR